MTTTQDPIATAARLLREAAEELRQAHAFPGIEGWENETDAKAAYDEHIAAAQALEDWEAAVGAGGVQALSAAPARDDRVPEAWTNLLAYVLQDDLHNRLTPRVIDIAYTAFNLAKQPNTEDGGASDWFTDTKPTVDKMIAKLRKDLIEDRAASPTPPAEQQARWVERWHGSGGKEFWEGWSILNAANREMIAHLGPDVGPDAVRGIVAAHNEALCGECAGTGGRWCPACAGATPPAEQQAAPKAAPGEWTEQDALGILNQLSDGPFGQGDVDDALDFMRLVDTARRDKAAPVEPDPADIIAGALQISRGHAIEMMRASLAASPTPTAEQQAATKAAQYEMDKEASNVRLDIDSNSTKPEQQRDVACSLEVGQHVGNGEHQGASCRGSKDSELLKIAARNLKYFIEHAQFSSFADKRAALNCLDALAAPQPAPAPLSDDVVKDAARWRWLSEHIGVAWDEGKFTSLVRIVSDKNRTALNASIDRMMAGDWSYAALAAQGGQ